EHARPARVCRQPLGGHVAQRLADRLRRLDGRVDEAEVGEEREDLAQIEAALEPRHPVAAGSGSRGRGTHRWTKISPARTETSKVASGRAGGPETTAPPRSKRPAWHGHTSPRRAGS